MKAWVHAVRYVRATHMPPGPERTLRLWTADIDGFDYDEPAPPPQRIVITPENAPWFYSIDAQGAVVRWAKEADIRAMLMGDVPSSEEPS